MFKPKKYVLPSGLTIVLVPMPESPTTTVEVTVKAGSKYESKKEAGLSHFLEHMCFKGTKKRPGTQALAKDLDDIGSVYNAWTSTEFTSYYAKASREHTEKLIDIVSDVYLNTVFKEDDIRREKGVIIEEINMYEDKPERIAAELFDKAMHGDQPAGRPVIGNKKTVASFVAEDFENYRMRHYVAKATTVAVAGHFDKAKVLKQIRAVFADASSAKKHAKEKVRLIRHKRVAARNKDTDQVHLVMGVRAFPYGDKRNTSLGVLRGVLSQGMSSRLWRKMRVELGICYYVHSHLSLSTDHGDFSISSGVDPKRVEVALGALCQELKRLKKDLVPKDELARTKNSMISGMYMSLESSDDVADYFTHRAVFYGDLKTPEERKKEINKVTAEGVREVAKQIFKDKELLLSIVGKNLNEAKLSKALSLE